MDYEAIAKVILDDADVFAEEIAAMSESERQKLSDDLVPESIKRITSILRAAEPQPAQDARELVRKINRLTDGFDLPSRIDEAAAEIERFVASRLAQSPATSGEAELRRALAWYADESHYDHDDWGVKSIIQPPEYGRPGAIARAALLAQPAEDKE